MKSMITYNSSSPFIRLILTPSITHLKMLYKQISFSMATNLLTLHSSKIEFLLVGLKQ